MTPGRSRPYGALLLLLWVSGLSISTGLRAAGISTNVALPVRAGGFVYRTQLRFLSASDDPTSLDRDIDLGVNRTNAAFDLPRCWPRKQLKNSWLVKISAPSRRANVKEQLPVDVVVNDHIGLQVERYRKTPLVINTDAHFSGWSRGFRFRAGQTARPGFLIVIHQELKTFLFERHSRRCGQFATSRRRRTHRREAYLGTG